MKCQHALVIRQNPTKAETAFKQYQASRIAYWDDIARKSDHWQGWGGYYWPSKHLALTNFLVARLAASNLNKTPKSTVSVVIPARNEAGHIHAVFERLPEMGSHTEIIFVEGHSTDNTYETIAAEIAAQSKFDCKLLKQTGFGKGDAVRQGFREASGDILMIMDADLSVPPEALV